MLAPALYKRFRDVAFLQAGIALKEGKEMLVESRIARRIHALGLPDAASYADILEQGPAAEIVEFIDAISTNFTSFFREPEHFDVLTEAAREWLAERRTRIRVWCAAASTGEEPYSILMTLDPVLKDRVDWRLLATDISTRVLGRAREGVFAGARVRSVPSHLRQQYFRRAAQSGDADAWEVRPPYRDRIAFARLNLSIPPYPLHGPLDAVFCRNVMIYFDAPMRQTVVTQVERLLRPGGLFFVGHAETLTGLNTRMRFVQPSVFRKPADVR